MGGMLGAAFVVYGDKADMVEQALNCVEFYRNESCGKCVPCRIGSQKMVDIIGDMLDEPTSGGSSLPLVNELAETMTHHLDLRPGAGRVEPDDDGDQVLSGRSGQVYKVATGAPTDS